MSGERPAKEMKEREDDDAGATSAAAKAASGGGGAASATSSSSSAATAAAPAKAEKKKSANQSVRSYLDQSVVPALLMGLAAVAKQRPENPLEFLGNFLIEQAKRPSAAGATPTEGGGGGAD